MVGYLGKGSPKSWYYGIKSYQPQLVNHDFKGFVKAFRDHFGDSNLAANTLRKLKALEQKGACAIYASRSRELHKYLSLDEFTRIDFFYQGLKDGIKDLLVTTDKSKLKKFDDYVAVCIEFDNRLHDRELERRHTYPVILIKRNLRV